MVRVIYLNFENEEEKKKIEKSLIPLLKYTPHWINRMTVRYRGDIDLLAQIGTALTMDNAILSIGPNLLGLNEEDRTGTLRHEMIHLCHSHVYGFVEDFLLNKDGENYAFLKKMFDYYLEEYTNLWENKI